MLPAPAIDVAQTLANQVRVLSVRQIASAFFASRKDPMDCARRAVRTLKRHGLVASWQTSLVEQTPEEPFWCGVADVTPIDAGVIAWRNAQRWSRLKPRITTCVQATGKALATFAGSCRPPRPGELEHDLTVSAVYLRLKLLGLAEGWRHEDTFASAGDLRGDATYLREDEVVTVEVLGRGYGREKVAAAYHQHKESQLELW